MKTILNTAGALAGALFMTLVPSKAFGLTISEDDFRDRLAEMTEAANASYVEDDEVTLNGQSYSVDEFTTTNVARVFTGVSTDPTFGTETEVFIVSFRGTNKGREGFYGDLIRDVQAATTPAAFTGNPWGGDASIRAGSGFRKRVVNYMDSNEGKTLKGDDTIGIQACAKNADKNCQIYVTGHSLGASASQIFSFYLSKWLQTLGLDEDQASKVKVINISFNTPRTWPRGNANVFDEELRGPFLKAFNFTRRWDPVSEWGSFHMRGSARTDNNGDTTTSANVDIGYCPHYMFDRDEEGSYAIDPHHGLTGDDSMKERIEAMDVPGCMVSEAGYTTFIQPLFDAG